MKLLIDAGNQRIKWATCLQLRAQSDTFACSELPNEPVETGSANLPDALEGAFAGMATPEGVWISSVAGAQVNRVLACVCHSLSGNAPIFVKSATRGKGLLNQYDKPEELGVDRWLAMVGGRQVSGKRPLLVIDAGTAVTIDYVDAQGVFEGGIIFPGMTTMIRSLGCYTGQIGLAGSTTANTMNVPLPYQNPGTREAVENGVTLAVVAAVERAIGHYKNLAGPDLTLILTGGEARRLAGASAHKIPMVADLVLRGLLALLEENR